MDEDEPVASDGIIKSIKLIFILGLIDIDCLRRIRYQRIPGIEL